ncbi:MAG: hypothetical protein JNM88_19160 [Chitinophagaceae bacterium]|nr:hypothetical protein [Chitinophagaceae bacterium]
MSIIGITGHRRLKYPKTIREEIRFSLQYFISIHTLPQVSAISAMAAGSDTIFAEEALALGIPVNAIFPFEEEEYQKDFTAEEWQQVMAVLSHPLCTLTIRHPGPVSSPEARTAAYLATGEFLVQQSAVLLAVWDEQPAKGRGGTAEIVQYALSHNREVHLVKGWRINSEEKGAGDRRLLEEFNSLDSRAIRFKEWLFEPAWIGGIIMGVLAAASFATGLAFGNQLTAQQRYIFSAGEAVCLLFSAILLLWLARRWKRKFLSYRKSAEYLRNLIRFRQAGIYVSGSTGSADAALLSTAAAEAIMQPPAGPSMPYGLHTIRRLIWCFAAEQAAYQQQKRINRFTHRLHTTEKILSYVKWLFFAVALLNFIVESEHYFHFILIPGLHSFHDVLILLWIVLPSVYAALEGVNYFSEWHTNIAISGQIKAELEDTMKTVLHCKDEKSLTAAAENLRHTLERENKNWLQNFGKKEPDIKP